MANELVRREFGGSVEPGLVDSPCWHAGLLSDALIACYCLSRLALSEPLARFCDQLEKHVVSSASAMLGEIAQRGVQVCA